MAFFSSQRREEMVSSRAMRTLRLLPLAVLVGCAPLSPVGAYSFTLSGTETQTAPGNDTSTSTGTGTLTINEGKADKSFVVVVAQTDSNPCTLNGTQSSSAPLTIDITPSQTCRFVYTGGQLTATIASGKIEVTNDDKSMTGSATLTISYAYAGQTLLFNFTGTGVRTYSGPRL